LPDADSQPDPEPEDEPIAEQPIADAPIDTAPDPEPEPEPPAPDPEPEDPEPPYDGPVVAGTDLHRRYGDGEGAVHALRGVDVAFESGTFNAIMGPSGSGKSTLMHVLAGLDRVTQGSVELNGVPLEGLRERELTRLRREHVGFVFQTFNLLPTLSVFDNVAMPLRLAGREVDREWVEELLDTFSLADRRRHRPAQLSGGQQQRVAIVRALVTRPSVVFADEPTGNLDSAAGDAVLDALARTVSDLGRAVVMVTHDPLAAARAERVVFLADGLVVREESRLSASEIVAALRER
jgi:putative ABC transport system ATP-binding protein